MKELQTVLPPKPHATVWLSENGTEPHGVARQPVVDIVGSEALGGRVEVEDAMTDTA
jgi:hypothetical protein